MTKKELTQEEQEVKLQEALRLIKKNITRYGQTSIDLHNVVQLIVDVARVHDLLMK